ncbi:MAG: hypothetical protein WAZ27_04490 [Minisyncoccia bacterium]
MQYTKSVVPWVITSVVLVGAVIFSISSVAFAKRDVRPLDDHLVQVQSGQSYSDDGTPDQGHGDTPVTAASIGASPASVPVQTLPNVGVPVQVEADVFTDITIVKVEINDKKTFFETLTRDKSILIGEIVEHFKIPSPTVSAVLDYEVEDRASRPKDRD